MGNEAFCRIEVDGVEASVKALLETEELVVRGDLRMRMPIAELEDVRVKGGMLHFRWQSKIVELELGPSAERWAGKILHPRSVIDKLGIKAQQRISIVGNVDDLLRTELEHRSGDVSSVLRHDSDVVFLVAEARTDLLRLKQARSSIKRSGSVWIVRPKAVEAITENDVLTAGRSAGLVDVKVVRLSATHSAEKFVIPVEAR
jgi:hypothetical protein